VEVQWLGLEVVYLVQEIIQFKNYIYLRNIRHRNYWRKV